MKMKLATCVGQILFSSSDQQRNQLNQIHGSAFNALAASLKEGKAKGTDP